MFNVNVASITNITSLGDSLELSLPYKVPLIIYNVIIIILGLGGNYIA